VAASRQVRPIEKDSANFKSPDGSNLANIISFSSSGAR